MVEELARMKRAFARRNTRQTQLPTDDVLGSNDGSSLASTAESSLRSGDYYAGGDGSGGDRGTGSATAHGTMHNVAGATKVTRGKQRKNLAVRCVEPRFSRFSVSVVVPRPHQHTGSTTAANITNIERGSYGAGRKNMDRAHSGGPYAAPSARSTSAPLSTPMTKSSTSSSSIPQTNPTASGCKIRLDIVRMDAERGGGGIVLPHRSVGAGAEEGGRGGGGGAAAASAGSDSAAKELLKWYCDEQVICIVYFWAPQNPILLPQDNAYTYHFTLLCGKAQYVHLTLFYDSPLKTPTFSLPNIWW